MRSVFDEGIIIKSTLENITHTDEKENIYIPNESVPELIYALVDLTTKVEEQDDYSRKTQKAKEIVEEIIEDLTDRKGLRHQWESIDQETREEIKSVWENIIFNNQE